MLVAQNSLDSNLLNREVKIAPLMCPGSYLGVLGDKVVLGKESDAVIEKIGNKEFRLRLDNKYIAHKEDDKVGLESKKKNKADMWNIKPKNGGFSLKSSRRKYYIGSQYCLTHTGCGVNAKLKFKKCTKSRENQLFSIEPKKPEEKNEDDPFGEPPQPTKPESTDFDKDIPTLEPPEEDNGEEGKSSEESSDSDPCQIIKNTVCEPVITPKQPDPIYVRPYYPPEQMVRTVYQYPPVQYAVPATQQIPTTSLNTAQPYNGYSYNTQGTSPYQYPSYYPQYQYPQQGNQQNQNVVTKQPSQSTTKKVTDCIVIPSANQTASKKVTSNPQVVYAQPSNNQKQPVHC